MAYKVFIGIIVLACAYMLYGSVSVLVLKSSAGKEYAGNILGAAQGDLTVVEFFDYSCTSCKDFAPVLMRAVEQDGSVRLVLRPISSDGGEEGKMIARLAYAAGRQGKFAQAHRNLIDNYRVVDDAYVEGFAEALDLDLQQLIQDMQDQDVADTLEENVKTLVRIGSVSIPTLLIGGKFVYSPGEKNNTSDTLMDLFNQARGL